jgi:hypothetical protein
MGRTGMGMGSSMWIELSLVVRSWRGNMSEERHGANVNVAMVNRGVMGWRGCARLLKSLALDARRLEKTKGRETKLRREGQ